MAADFGAGRTGGGVPLAAVAAVLVVVLAAGVWFMTEPRWAAEAKHWTVQGPPCRQITAQEFQTAGAGAPRLQVENFDDIDFGRAYGHVSCADIHDHGGMSFGMHAVCQFSSPTRVVVRTSRGQAYFAAQPGQPVTVSVIRDRPQCVIGGNEWGAAAS